MPAQVAAAARERGIRVNEDLAKKNLKQIQAVYRPLGPEAMQGSLVPGGDLTLGYIMMALAAEKHPLDKMTAALAHGVASRQMPDGSWIEGQTRPPMEYSTISRTAMAVRTITLYRIESRRAEIDERLRRAHTWLLGAKPQSAEEYAMRLMALAWTNASRAELDTVAREWIAQQNADGGWSQLPAPGNRRLCDRHHSVRDVRGGHPRHRRGLQERCGVPAQEPIPGRKLVREDALVPGATAVRERLPVWIQPMDLVGGSKLGFSGDRQYAGAAVVNHIANRAAISSIPSHRFCIRMFSLKLCWLLSWFAIGTVIVGAFRISLDHVQRHAAAHRRQLDDRSARRSPPSAARAAKSADPSTCATRCSRPPRTSPWPRFGCDMRVCASGSVSTMK